MSLEVFIIHIKVLLPVLQRVVATLLDVVNQQAVATVVGVNTLNVRETKSLVGKGGTNEVCNVVNPVRPELMNTVT